MTPYELFLYLCVAGFEILLCLLVYSRRLQRRLPFFAAYATTMLACCIGIGVAYARFGYESLATSYVGWSTVAIILLARSSAVAELCHESLRGYPGIWALTWRVLSVLSLLFFVHAAIDARDHMNWLTTFALTIERDVEIAAILILLAIWLIGKYYRLTVEPLQKWLGLGIGLFCMVDFLNNSAARELFAQYFLFGTTMKLQIARESGMWNTVRTLASVASLVVWCNALRKPLPAPAKPPVLLPAEVYRELSPAINLRLRAFNDRLVELLRP